MSLTESERKRVSVKSVSAPKKRELVLNCPCFTYKSLRAYLHALTLISYLMHCSNAPICVPYKSLCITIYTLRTDEVDERESERESEKKKMKHRTQNGYDICVE